MNYVMMESLTNAMDGIAKDEEMLTNEVAEDVKICLENIIVNLVKRLR